MPINVVMPPTSRTATIASTEPRGICGRSSIEARMVDQMVVMPNPPGLLGGLDRADLSPWFNPFLEHFAREAVRCGGEVRVSREGETVQGLTVWDPVERVASVFTRSQSLAQREVRSRGAYGMFCDFSFDAATEPFDIFSITLGAEPPRHRFRHSIRPYSSADRPAVVSLMREVYGSVNERWFDGLPVVQEVGFVAEIDRRLAGAAWVSEAGGCARLHSLTVRAPHRRMGLGCDLLAARLLWAHRTGARTILSEISRTNVASQALAEQGGMRRVGEIYFHRPL